MSDLPFDSMRLTYEATDRCPPLIDSMHQYTLAVIEVLQEWGFLLVVKEIGDTR